MKFEKINIIGLGYIGLPTAALFASSGSNVIGVDTSKEVVCAVNSGHAHIIEPDLDELVRDVVARKKLTATHEPETSDVFVIAVQTPLKSQSGGKKVPDLSYVKAACVSIAEVLEPENLVILESTSPVGTTEMISTLLAELRPDLRLPSIHEADPNIFIAHCPERVLPGKIIYELRTNDRIIGGLTEDCSSKAAKLYRLFAQGECVRTDARTAELTKLTENASRDVQIAFANELSLICDELGLSIRELISLANRHPRVNILNPGPGVGGHCIAVDPWFIYQSDPQNSRMIKVAREINDYKPVFVSNKIFRKLSNIEPARVILFGATYKENIDDLRESPSLKIAKELQQKYDIKIIFVEPNILQKTINGFDNINIAEVDFQNDLCVFLVRHRQFSSSKFKPKFYLDIVGLYADQ